MSSSESCRSGWRVPLPEQLISSGVAYINDGLLNGDIITPPVKRNRARVKDNHADTRGVLHHVRAFSAAIVKLWLGQRDNPVLNEILVY